MAAGKLMFQTQSMKGCVKICLNATIVGVVSGFLVFGLFAASIAPDRAEGGLTPHEDFFLVSVNLLPMAFIACVVSFVSLQFGRHAFHVSMTVLFGLFVIGLTSMFWATVRPEVLREDIVYFAGMLVSGMVLLTSHWGFAAYKKGQGELIA